MLCIQSFVGETIIASPPAPHSDSSRSSLPPRRAPARPAGIRDVAERAGVGIASVSRVLSGQRGVSDAMATRVKDAARELGYRPNVLAQSLRRRTTRSVGFVVSDITNPLIAAVVGGAESLLSEAGFSVLLTHSGGVPERDAERIAMLARRQVDGFMVLPAREDEPETVAALRNATAPVVVIDRTMAADLDTGAVLSDHYAGVHAAASHLFAHGHRRIGLVVGRDVRPSRERLRAVVDAALSLAPGADVSIDAGLLSADHGDRAMNRYLDERSPRTAVILGGNQLLVGALDALRRRGRRVGRDVSLVCCDDVPLCRLYEPPIATVSRDTAAIGREAARMLIERIAGRPPRIALLPTRFDARASCGPAPR